jgi:hypothetical protein
MTLARDTAAGATLHRKRRTLRAHCAPDPLERIREVCLVENSKAAGGLSDGTEALSA